MHEYARKSDLNRCCWNSKRKLGVTTHFLKDNYPVINDINKKRGAVVRTMGLPAVGPGSNPVLIVSWFGFVFLMSWIQLYLPVGILPHVSVKFELFLSDHLLKVGCL